MYDKAAVNHILSVTASRRHKVAEILSHCCWMKTVAWSLKQFCQMPFDRSTITTTCVRFSLIWISWIMLSHIPASCTMLTAVWLTMLTMATDIAIRWANMWKNMKKQTMETPRRVEQTNEVGRIRSEVSSWSSSILSVHKKETRHSNTSGVTSFYRSCGVVVAGDWGVGSAVYTANTAGYVAR